MIVDRFYSLALIYYNEKSKADLMKNVCNICNSVILRIFLTHHMKR